MRLVFLILAYLVGGHGDKIVIARCNTYEEAADVVGHLQGTGRYEIIKRWEP